MDRQDIDALLIGSLYGELTPADQARLAAHLDSHPADRTALDDLNRARQAVRDSRIFEQQLDPPKAVSALLLQEAHRRAPRSARGDDAKQGWFARFALSLSAHPAMAAAAMLVVVVGVAGTLYVRNGAQLAEPKLAVQGAPSAAPIMTVPQAQPGATGSADPSTTAYQVKLDEHVGTLRGEAVQAADEPAAEKAHAAEVEKTPPAKERRRDEPSRKSAVANDAKLQLGIAVKTKAAMPKDLDYGNADKASKKAGKAESMTADDEFSVAPGSKGAVSGGAAGPAPASKPSAAPQAPAPAAVAAPATRAPANNGLIAWATTEHKRAVDYARNGDCGRAAQIAVVVGNRAVDYYNQFMATDRALKECQPYIASEREKDAARNAKTRPTSKASATESPP